MLKFEYKTFITFVLYDRSFIYFLPAAYVHALSLRCFSSGGEGCDSKIPRPNDVQSGGQDSKIIFKLPHFQISKLYDIV